MKSIIKAIKDLFTPHEHVFDGPTQWIGGMEWVRCSHPGCNMLDTTPEQDKRDRAESEYWNRRFDYVLDRKHKDYYRDHVDPAYKKLKDAYEIENGDWRQNKVIDEIIADLQSKYDEKLGIYEAMKAEHSAKYADVIADINEKTFNKPLLTKEQTDAQFEKLREGGYIPKSCPAWSVKFSDK